MKNQVSVIIVTYNSAAYVADCLDSIRAHEYEPVEVIVYDNASTDDTKELIRRRYPEVRLVEGDSNIGFAAANNEAARLATGGLLAFLNPDTIVEPGWLGPLLEALEADETVGAVTPQLVLASDPGRINACGNGVHLSGIPYCRGFGTESMEGPIAEVNAISGAAFVMRKVLFKEIGGLEPSFFMYYEDTDLSLRMRLTGLRCLVVPASRVRHAYNASLTPQKLLLLERNRLLSLLSLMDWRVLVLMMPSLLVAELLVWGHCILQGRDTISAKASAWRQVLRRWGWIRERRNLRTARLASPGSVLQGFSSRLSVGYANTNGGILTAGAEFASWIVAAPVLITASLLYRRRHH